MTRLLYWMVYHLDLGPLGPRLLSLAVRSWLKRRKRQAAEPTVRQRAFGRLTTLHLEPSFGADERM
jgi:hypothetical protein